MDEAEREAWRDALEEAKLAAKPRTSRLPAWAGTAVALALGIGLLAVLYRWPSMEHGDQGRTSIVQVKALTD